MKPLTKKELVVLAHYQASVERWALDLAECLYNKKRNSGTVTTESAIMEFNQNNPFPKVSHTILAIKLKDHKL